MRDTRVLILVIAIATSRISHPWFEDMKFRLYVARRTWRFYHWLTHTHTITISNLRQ